MKNLSIADASISLLPKSLRLEGMITRFTFGKSMSARLDFSYGKSLKLLSIGKIFCGKLVRLNSIGL